MDFLIELDGPPLSPALTLPFFRSGLFRDNPVLAVVEAAATSPLGLEAAATSPLGLLIPDGAFAEDGGGILDCEGALILDKFPRVKRGFGVSVDDLADMIPAGHSLRDWEV